MDIKQKLWEQFNYFCKYKCLNRNQNIWGDIEAFCPVCDEKLEIYEEVDACKFCTTKDFIREIRDEIGE